MADYEGFRTEQISCEERDRMMLEAVTPPDEPKPLFCYREEVKPWAGATNMEPGGRITTDWGWRDEKPYVRDERIVAEHDGTNGSCAHWKYVPDE